MNAIIEKTNTGKLLAVILAVAVAIVGMAVVLSDNVEATEPVSLDAEDFLELADEETGVIKLENDVMLTGTVTLDKSITIDLNGFTLSSDDSVTNMFYNAGGENGADAGTSNVDLTIDGTTANSTIDASKRITFFRAADCDLTINGGKYISGDFAFIWYSVSGSTTTTVNVTDAEVEGQTSAFWLSNGPIANATFTNCDITTSGLGIYIGTVQNTVITDCNITATGKDSAIEIKAGSVSIDGCNISAAHYNESTETGSSSSSDSVSAIVINSAYSSVAGTEEVEVDITDSKITNSAEGSKAIILMSNKGDAPLDVAWEGHDSDDFTVKGDNAEGITISENPDRDFSNSVTYGDGAIIDADSYFYASKTQEVIIDGNVTTINDGATLTVEKGGYINVGASGIVDIQGDLIVEAGTGTASDGYTGYSFDYKGCNMNVAGSVTLEGANSFNSEGSGVIISGLFEIGESATATFKGAEITETGELTVLGVVEQGSTITNNGTITIDSQGIPDAAGTAVEKKVDMTVQLGTTGTVDIINVYGKVTINDDDLTYTVKKTEQAAKNNSEVVLENVAGVLVTEKLDTEKGTAAMLISGSINYADDYVSANKKGTVTVSAGATSNVEIAEATTLGEGVKLTVNGKLTVSAEMNATAEKGMIDVAGELTVTGKITTDGGIKNTMNTGKINAAKYSIQGTSNIVYTTLQTALADNITSIDLLGANTVTSDATIPVGTTVKMTDGSKLTINKDVTLTVASDDRKSGKLNTVDDDCVIVNGTLVLDNQAKSGVDIKHVLSDTSKTSGDSMTFTNIYKALADAADGETVKITRGTELLVTEDIEVKTGVTLQIPTGEVVTVNYGVTVTVNGTVDVDGGVYTINEGESEDDESTTDVDESVDGVTIVNGMFKYDDVDKTAIYSAQIVGAYFAYDGTYVIAPLASVPAIADDLESDVELYGDMDLGAIDFSAYTGNDLTVYAKNKLTIESITIGNVVFDTTDATFVTGTINMANGTVDLDNVKGIVASNEAGEEDTTVSTISGKVSAYNYPETTDVTETGSVNFTGEISTSAAYGTGIKAAVPTGATLTVTGGSFDDLTVIGTVEATESFSANSVVVSGTLTIAEKKTMNVTTLYAGVTVETVDGKIIITGNTAAKISGTVGAPTSGTITAYVGPDATVPESITKINANVQYFVQNELYVTAYTTTNVAINSIGAEYPDARFDGWMDEKGVAIDDELIGGTDSPAKVYADLDFNICKVDVNIVPGAIIYIDGKMYYDGTGPLNPISVGEHTINVYKDGGFSGEPVITVNGQTVANGGTFTASADSTTEISVTGIEAGAGEIVINNGSSDDMSLTDILLIVLVVLIVIMAVIVALRLMRS